MGKKCSNCGAPAIDDQALFCNKCGSKIPEVFSNKISLCDNCGTPVIDDQALFCNKCGNSIRKQKTERKLINEKSQIKSEKIQFVDPPKKYAHIPLVAENTGKSDYLQDEKITLKKIENLSKNWGNAIKKIEETRCTCSACGKVWYFGKKEVYNNYSKMLRNAGKTISGATCCCWPMSYMSREETDMGKCPSCGSKAIKKEQVTHEVE